MALLDNDTFGEIDDFTKQMVTGLFRSVLSDKSDEELRSTLESALQVITQVLETADES